MTDAGRRGWYESLLSIAAASRHEWRERAITTNFSPQVERRREFRSDSGPGAARYLHFR